MFFFLSLGLVYGYLVLKYFSLSYDVNGGLWFKYILGREYIFLSFLLRDVNGYFGGYVILYRIKSLLISELYYRFEECYE